MKAETVIENQKMTVAVNGEINTITTPALAEKVADLSGVSTLIFDLDQVPYVSSAGLRLFLSCQRTINSKHGEMRIINCNEFLFEIFSSVGYDRIMKLEQKEKTGGTNGESEG